MTVVSVPSSAIELVAMLKGTEPPGLGLPEQIAHQLETAIMMGILKAGDRLPPETELATALGISPVTLRHSLSILRAKELIETSRGRSGGSVVRGSPETSETKVLRTLRATSTEDLRDLGDLSAAVSSMSAKLAAQRADDANIAYLERLAHQYRKSADPQTRQRNDGLFHLTIGVAAQSSRLTGAMLQIQAELSTLLWVSNEHQDIISQAIQQHADIVDAISRRDSMAAATAASTHSQTETHLLISRRLKLMLDSPEVV